MLEKELFPPLKKYLKELGYTVYCEVPNHYRSVDVVAVKDNVHVAIELKVAFNAAVVRQASSNRFFFHRSYVGVPAKVRLLGKTMEWCRRFGVGVFLINESGVRMELEARDNVPMKIYDFSLFQERDDDEAGLPYQKGVSEAAVDLERIKHYVTLHPFANWKEIFRNVQNHYSSPKSLAGSMKQWRGFSLYQFKEQLRRGTT